MAFKVPKLACGRNRYIESTLRGVAVMYSLPKQHVGFAVYLHAFAVRSIQSSDIRRADGSGKEAFIALAGGHACI